MKLIDTFKLNQIVFGIACGEWRRRERVYDGHTRSAKKKNGGVSCVSLPVKVTYTINY